MCLIYNDIGNNKHYFFDCRLHAVPRPSLLCKCSFPCLWYRLYLCFQDQAYSYFVIWGSHFFPREQQMYIARVYPLHSCHLVFIRSHIHEPLFHSLLDPTGTPDDPNWTFVLFFLSLVNIFYFCLLPAVCFYTCLCCGFINNCIKKYCYMTAFSFFQKL